MRKLTIISTCAVALATAGCGLADPYRQGGQQTAPQHRPGAQRTPGAASPTQAIERFGQTWVNWSSATLAQNRRELATLATGDMRSVLLQDATKAAADAARPGPRWASTGDVEGVLLRAGGRALVVARETAGSADGGAQPSYLVYLARVESTSDGWKVAEWQRTS